MKKGGWVRENQPTSQEAAGELDFGPGGAESSPGQAAPAARLASRAMMDSQRDAVLAEILGDVSAISRELQEVVLQIKATSQALNANDFVRWRNTLDSKFTEIQEVNFSDESARRLKVLVDTYLGQMAVQINQLAHIEVKKAVAKTLAFQTLFDRLHREWLLRLAAICATVVLGTVLGNFVWAVI